MEAADTDLDAAESDRPLDALCARHPDRRASIVCPQCGTYACGDCTVDTLWGDVMCEACERHGRAQYPLPFEQEASPAALLHSAYLVFADTRSLFGAFPAGPLRRALWFALSVAALTAFVRATVEQLFAPRHWAAASPGLSWAFALTLVVELAGSALFVVLCAAIFHGVALLLGGRGSFVTALRASCYVSAVGLLNTGGRVVDLMLSSDTFTILLGLISLFFVAFALSLLGQRRYGLSQLRALCAALAPLAFLTAAGVGLLAGVSFLHRKL